jgi:uncharacterized lipoprotein YmbA
MKGDRKGFRSANKTGSITHSLRYVAGWGGILLFMAVAGCAGSQKSSYFTLYPMTWLTPKYVSEDTGISIGIGPVSIPEYLNRSQIVSRPGRYEIEISDINLWAESLDATIPKIVSENISKILSTDRVYIYPWTQKAPDYQVKIDIIQFDGSMPGNVVIFSRWSLLKDGEETDIINQQFNTRKPIAGQGYEGMVSTMSLVLYDLCYHIGETINIKFLETPPIDTAAPH